MTERPITLFHAPQTRSSGVLALLEELGAPYTLQVLNRAKDELRSPAFLAINPLGKVPALQDGAAVVTEQVAIFLHLADLFPQAGLAPAIQDQLRGPYLRWMLFYAAAFEPAVVDKGPRARPGNAGDEPLWLLPGGDRHRGHRLAARPLPARQHLHRRRRVVGAAPCGGPRSSSWCRSTP